MEISISYFAGCISAIGALESIVVRVSLFTNLAAKGHITVAGIESSTATYTYFHYIMGHSVSPFSTPILLFQNII